MRNGGGLGGIGRQHRQHDLSVQRTQRCIAENITDVIDHFHLSMKTFSTAKKITFTDHINRGIFEKIRNVPQTIFKPSVHHSSRFFGKLFGAIGDAVFVVGFGAAHNETLGVAKKKISNHNNITTTSQQHHNNITISQRLEEFPMNEQQTKDSVRSSTTVIQAGIAMISTESSAQSLVPGQ